MKTITRRECLGRGVQGAIAAAGTAAWAVSRPAFGFSANEKITLGVIGIQGRGYALAMRFAARPDCRVAYLADVDSSLFGGTAGGYQDYVRRYVDPSLCGPRVAGIEKAQGKAPQTVGDFRRILDDKSVDAIVVATPDHWHAPATVWGCQAGKDVFVEKPISHSPWEGRKMVEAARKHERVVQVGTQTRSAAYMTAAKRFIEEGKLGKIHLCRVLNMKHWPNFAMSPDRNPPEGFDWEMWNGPAPEHAYNPTLHRAWNHFWRYSGGDIINQGIHQLDMARWLCGVDYPKAVSSSGGRFHGPGAAETPDTQVATFEFDNMMMVFEMALYTPYMLKTDQELRDKLDMFPYWPQNSTRIEIYGDAGVMCVGDVGGGWQVFGRPENRQPVVIAQQKGPYPDREHHDNFVECIRSRKRPNADIEEGHRSTLLCQYANISYRLGGQKLLVDSRTETFTNSAEANALLKREYRKPWVVPEEV